jgi:hypothetical protein
MAEASKDPHPDELRSDLDVLIEMVKDAKQDQQVIHRHFDALSAKLHTFVHKHGTQSGAAN